MIPEIPRRHFLGASAAAAFSGFLSENVFAQEESPRSDRSSSSQTRCVFGPRRLFPDLKITFSQTGNNVRFFIPGLRVPSKILHLSDTHIFLDDERGKSFERFSARMAAAYHRPTHCRTGKTTNPMEAFEESLVFAKREKVDAVTLTGDILSFSSEAGVDWLLEKLKTLDEAGIPWFFISGNHDWHYEGWPGTDEEKRAEWAPKRLGKLYPENANFLNYSAVMKGIRHLFVDDSIYEILPEQLRFLKAELAHGEPTVLWMHIPPYAPGRNVGFGCGHPEWGKETDKNWQIERREPWRAGGHTDVTFEFYETLLKAPNLMGTFCGHVHVNALDIVNGKPFTTTEANAAAGWRVVEFLPQETYRRPAGPSPISFLP